MVFVNVLCRKKDVYKRQDKGRDRRKRTDGSESTVGQSDAAVIPDSYAEKGIHKELSMKKNYLKNFLK